MAPTGVHFRWLVFRIFLESLPEGRSKRRTERRKTTDRREERYFPLCPEILRPGASWRMMRQLGSPNEMQGLPRCMDRLKLGGQCGRGRSSIAAPDVISASAVTPTTSVVTSQSSRPETSKALSLTGSWFPSLGLLTFDSSLPFVSVSLSVPAFLSLNQCFPVSLFLSQLPKVLSPLYSHFSQ